MPYNEKEASDLLEIRCAMIELGKLTALSGQGTEALKIAMEQFKTCVYRAKKELDELDSLRKTPWIFAIFQGQSRAIKRRQTWDRIESDLEPCRVLFHAVTLVLADVLRAADLPNTSLANLFSSDRKSFGQVMNDVQILTNFYEPLMFTIKTKRDAFDVLTIPYTISSTPTGSKDDTPTVARYERDAYLSFVAAIQKASELANRPLTEVHAWIKEHGVELDGKEYDPPEFPTWQRYRSAGEKAAKSGGPS